jgi:hypothetical protein
MIAGLCEPAVPDEIRGPGRGVEKVHITER